MTWCVVIWGNSFNDIESSRCWNFDCYFLHSQKNVPVDLLVDYVGCCGRCSLFITWGCYEQKTQECFLASRFENCDFDECRVCIPEPKAKAYLKKCRWKYTLGLRCKTSLAPIYKRWKSLILFLLWLYELHTIYRCRFTNRAWKTLQKTYIHIPYRIVLVLVPKHNDIVCTTRITL